MAAPITVIVRWCGGDYPFEVPSSDTIADLKRKFSDAQKLPVKRQRFKDNTLARKCLDDNVLVSSLPGNIANLVGLNQKNNESYKQSFREHKADGLKAVGFCYVTDLREPLTDFDGTRLAISRGIYEVVNVNVECLLKTAAEKTTPDSVPFELDSASFGLMRKFRHRNSVTMENLYDSGPSLRLILSDLLDGTFAGYVNKWGGGIVFNSDAGTFTSFFSKIMTELCGVLDKLLAQGICPKNLSKHNLYLKMVGADPQLKVLFNSVEPFAEETEDQNKQLMKLCANIKDIFNTYVPDEVIAEMTHFRSFLGEKAAKYIGKNLGKIVKCYPYDWTDSQKGSYLIDVISSSLDLRPPINSCGISWPTKESAEGKELETIEQIIKKINTRKIALKLQEEEAGDTVAANKIRLYIWNYYPEFPHDLVRLARNLWKHWDTYPWSIRKLLGGSQVGALRALERWCPGVWCLVYNAVGFACKFLFLCLCV